MSAIKGYNSTEKNSFDKHKSKSMPFVTKFAASILIVAAFFNPTTLDNQAYAAQHENPPPLAMMNSGPAPSMDIDD